MLDWDKVTWNMIVIIPLKEAKDVWQVLEYRNGDRWFLYRDVQLLSSISPLIRSMLILDP